MIYYAFFEFELTYLFSFSVLFVYWFNEHFYGFTRYKTESGQKLEPVEEVTIEVIIPLVLHSMLACPRVWTSNIIMDLFQVNDEHVGLIMEALSHRRAEVTDMGPVSGTVGRTRLCLTCPSRLAWLSFSCIELISLICFPPST